MGDRTHSCVRTDFLVLVLGATVLLLVLERTQMTEPIFDHERLYVYRLAIVSGNQWVARFVVLCRPIRGFRGSRGKGPVAAGHRQRMYRPIRA